MGLRCVRGQSEVRLLRLALETQHRAAVGVSFGVRTRHVRHPRLAMGGEAGRAISRTQGTFASGNGGAVAPLPDGDAEGGSQEGQAEENVDGAMETSPSRWHPCWADKWLKVPDGGFCQVPWNGVVVAQVMILWFASFLLVGHVGLPSAVRWLGFNCQELSARGSRCTASALTSWRCSSVCSCCFSVFGRTSLCRSVGSRRPSGADGLRRFCWDAHYSRS